MDPTVISLALSSATQSGSAFSNFLPKFSEIRKAGPDDLDMMGDVRMGEVAALTITLGIGIIASSLSQSSVPAIAAGVMCLIFVVLYEYALRADHPFERK